MRSGEGRALHRLMIRRIRPAYAKPALRGHSGGNLALDRNHARKGTDAGDIAAYAHLIEYGWITGGGPLFEEAMCRHVRKLAESQLEAHEEAARWRRLSTTPRAHPRCAHTERPS